MNVVDSSCWIEYLMNSDIGAAVAPAIEDSGSLIVPSICLYEVYKKLAAEKSEAFAMEVISYMKSGKIIVLDETLSVFAAQVSRKHKLPAVDSIIYATTTQNAAILWTCDKHFQDIPGIRYFPKSA